MNATNFTQAEINDFREIFSFWAEKVRKLEMEAKLRRESEDFVPPDLKRALTRTMGIDQTDKSNARNQYLSLDGMMRVVRSLGLQMNHDERKVLQDTISALPRAHPKKFEFFEFLLLMRWLLDNNFSGMNTALRHHTVPAEIEPAE